jgi:hypothetical protein
MHPNVFTENLTIPLAEHREFDHEIKTTDDIPVSYKPYPLTKEEREYLHKWIDELVKSGQYRPSKSPWAAPLFFKHEVDPDGKKKLRPLVDY